MELGEKLKQRRLELGLSQRAVCGQQITRNMLSQIESGSASPSLATLQYLAARMEKPVSFFLGEPWDASPNVSAMEAARAAYRQGAYQQALAELEMYRMPDPMLDEEYRLLLVLTLLSLAEQALEQKQPVYASALLQRAEDGMADSLYCGHLLARQRILQMARTHPHRSRELVADLPSLDGELLLRAAAALESGAFQRCAALLEAAEDHSTPQWNLLRGEAYFGESEYAPAIQCYRLAEQTYPNQAIRRLESCYRELGDYQQAYACACRLRGE